MLNYDQLSVKYKSFLTRFSAETEPQTYAQAYKDPIWIDAMQTEIKAFEENQIWIIPLPEGKKTIDCTCIYKIKYKATREVWRFKTRLVAKGYSQQEGLDDQETFSPIVKMVTVKAIISLAAAKNWNIHQIDVYNDFYRVKLMKKFTWLCLKDSITNKGGCKCADYSNHHMDTNKHIDNGISTSQLPYYLLVLFRVSSTILYLLNS